MGLLEHFKAWRDALRTANAIDRLSASLAAPDLATPPGVDRLIGALVALRDESTAYVAACVFADTIGAHVPGDGDRLAVMVDCAPDLPTEQTHIASALAAFVAARYNDDTEGTLSVWHQLGTSGAIQMTVDLGVMAVRIRQSGIPLD